MSNQIVEWDNLLNQLRSLISEARTQVLLTVDVIHVRTCWEIGRHIVEFEQEGQVRASYGKRLIPQLSEQLTQEFGRGFDASNLRYMRLFYHSFPNCDALRHELSWTHYRRLIRVDNEAARQWYMNSEQLFASRYKLVLPSEEELRLELERERALLQEQAELKNDRKADG